MTFWMNKMYLFPDFGVQGTGEQDPRGGRFQIRRSSYTFATQETFLIH